MSTNLPINENQVNTQTPISKVFSAERRRLRLPAKLKKLSDVSNDFVFWTPALLYMYGRLTDAVLQEAMAAANEEIPLLYTTFGVKLFSGLEDVGGDSGWNYTLFLCPKEQWGHLENYLCGAVMYNTYDEHVCKYAIQDVVLLDPLVVLPSSEEVVAVNVFGVLSNFGVYSLRTDNAGSPPQLVKNPADAFCVSLANSLFKQENMRVPNS